MRTKKGFTLAEMVAVIAILMFLAVISTPFIKRYINDSYNGKAKIYMRELHEARLNFEKDYPGTTVSSGSGSAFTTCDLDAIYGQTGLVVDASILEACNYLTVPTDIEGRYTFTLGGSCVATGCGNPVATMVGKAAAGGDYNGKCTCLDAFGEIHQQ